MFDRLRRIIDHQPLVVLFIFSLLNVACSFIKSTTTENLFTKFKTSEMSLEFGDLDKFEFENVAFVSDQADRVLVRYEKKEKQSSKDLGHFFRISEDGGESFGREYEAAKLIDGEFNGYVFYFTENGLSATVTAKDGNLFYTASDESFENWSVPIQINDENGSIAGGLDLLSKNENDLFIAFMDKRRGFDQIFFSASGDGGKTWSPNQPVESDFRKGRQGHQKLLIGEDGRLFVFWEDWRDNNTLVDIRCSYTDDSGKTWSPSQKINDDEEEVWQRFPAVVADGPNIYVTFSDFREKGEGDDGDWNIYFARSTDNGATWEKNRRLNDIKEGRDLGRSLVKDKDGTLYCMWWTTRETLFGQLAFSYSNDGGKSWSPSIALTPRNEMVKFGWSSILNVSSDKLIVHWVREEYGLEEIKFSFLQNSMDPLFLGSDERPVEEETVQLKYQLGSTLFTDDFSKDVAEKWETVLGFWDVVDGTYMGVNPDKERSFMSLAKFNETDRYVLTGRFKLDKVAHISANIYFRVGKKGLRHYVITNHFRRGVWLSIKDNDLPNGLNVIGGKPLVQKRFSFRQDRWYQFKVIVTPEKLDYYIDGLLMLTQTERLTLPKGRFGVGGWVHAPTYFDDISVSGLKQ